MFCTVQERYGITIMPRPQPEIIRTLQRDDLEPVRLTLNDPSMQGSKRLRELVERWWKHNYDLRRMLAEDKELYRELKDVAKVNLIPTADGAQLELRQEKSDQAWGDVLQKYHRRDPVEGERMAAHVKANFHFVALVLNPWRKALGRCSNPNCQKYFLKQRMRAAKKPKYCSSACRGPSETLRKFHEVRNEKLLLARRYLYQLRNTKDWKKKLAKKLGVTPNWVTWAVSQGDLRDPSESEKPRRARRSRV